MRVAFLTQDLQLSGGVGVVVEHARQLAERHDFDVSLVLTRRRVDADWAFPGLEALQVLDLEHARYQPRYDVAIASWWETTEALFELDADRHAVFVQSLEDRFYGVESVDRMHAALAQSLPARHITEARWIAEALDGLRGERDATLYVRNGIAKALFPPVDTAPIRRDGPLRILIEGSLAVAFKGVGDAFEAVAEMREQRHVTLISPDGVGADQADAAIGPLTHAEMAGAYTEADVILKLSRVEGMFGPPLEAFHCGATCVVTPVTGHEEYVRHGWNGLVVDFDDPTGTARALDLLARDRRYLHFLRCNAAADARAWPSWEQQGTVMATALRRIRSDPPPDVRPAGRRLALDIASAQADAERWVHQREAAFDSLEELRNTTAYKLGIRLRRIALAPLRPLRALRARLRRG